MRYKLILSNEDGTNNSTLVVESPKVFTDPVLAVTLLKRMKQAVDRHK